MTAAAFSGVTELSASCSVEQDWLCEGSGDAMTAAAVFQMVVKYLIGL